jgi:hypothetical protein
MIVVSVLTSSKKATTEMEGVNVRNGRESSRSSVSS